MKYKVGDKLRVRSWNAMEREYGLDNLGGIDINRSYRFPYRDRNICGQVVTIAGHDSECYETESHGGDWIDEMFEGYAFEYGEELEFSDNGEDWETHIYLGYTDGANYPYICVRKTDRNEYKAGNNFRIYAWKQARPIQKVKIDFKLTSNGNELSKISKSSLIEIAKANNIEITED